MYHIEITAPAERDILEAARYINEQLLNPSAANRLLDKAEEAIASLSDMPKRYALVRDETLAQSGIRLMPVLNYLVFYTVRDKRNCVVIQRFLYKKRDWTSILIADPPG
ncbi:MAG: type II toxin-antitoxin system RelE/ParE family toxin [Oscillospiraceae bacterium]|nr:type II toxin-antitoxin system RelE/ParE family toxin [Oscillospiraceae bacterium]